MNGNYVTAIQCGDNMCAYNEDGRCVQWGIELVYDADMGLYCNTYGYGVLSKVDRCDIPHEG